VTVPFRYAAVLEAGGSAANTTPRWIADFVVEHPEDTFPRIDAIIVKTRYGELAAPIGEVASLDTGGVVLTTARCLGEYGAVAIVSGKLEGQTETAALRVQDAYENFNTAGAYAISLVLAAISVVVLVAMTLLKPREEGA